MLSSIRFALGAVSIAFAFVACAPPTLDATGRIRCGTDGGCPTDFECRWDHCCPTGSAFSTCPAAGTTFVHDTTGQTYAPIDGHCPENMELRFEHCCPMDAGSECPTGVVGARCTRDDECTSPSGMPAVCVTTQIVDQLHQTFTRGYCSAACDPNIVDACGASGICAPSADRMSGSCLRRCTLATGALFGPCGGSAGSQQCITAQDPGDPTLGICLPDCSADENAGQCASGYSCIQTEVGAHACLRPCDPSRGQLCVASGGGTCSSATGPGYCR